jgi:hypothetical protein
MMSTFDGRNVSTFPGIYRDTNDKLASGKNKVKFNSGYLDGLFKDGVFIRGRVFDIYPNGTGLDVYFTDFKSGNGCGKLFFENGFWYKGQVSIRHIPRELGSMFEINGKGTIYMNDNFYSGTFENYCEKVYIDRYRMDSKGTVDGKLTGTYIDGILTILNSLIRDGLGDLKIIELFYN